MDTLRNTRTDWNFLLFIFLLLSPTVVFLLAVILFPDNLSEKDFKVHFYSNRLWFFMLAALLPPIDAVDTLLKGYVHFRDQGPLYVIILATTFVLSLVASTTDDERFHRFFAVFFLCYILAVIGTNLLTLA